MSGRIYVINDGELQAMESQPFAAEDDFQELLVNYPDLLIGDASDHVGQRWMLVTREMGVPDSESSGDRWAVDHLFLDQDAIPTLVEVKRSSDTRLRREVVGQMLDYAANAPVYWQLAEIQSRFEQTCEEAGKDPSARVLETIGKQDGDESDVDDFWLLVDTNLRAGRLRLIFVADVIPPELRRIVEFLNAQMNPAEVIALELRQYESGGLQVLVPTTLGQTAASERTKSGGSARGPQWDEARFMDELERREDAGVRAAAKTLLDWSTPLVDRISWGRGGRSGSFWPVIDTGHGWHTFFVVWTYGTIELQFAKLARTPPFDDLEKRQELRHRLNSITNVEIPADGLARRPGLPVAALQPSAEMAKFQSAFQWAFDEVREPSGG